MKTSMAHILRAGSGWVGLKCAENFNCCMVELLMARVVR